jgi:23S rRNA (adenine2030-N6)-methyltransferase
VIDTHAGIGLYDLTSTEAEKTGEWRDGIGRLIGPDAAALPPNVVEALGPYLDAVAGCNPEGALVRYPGSPLIARRLMRPGDVLIANELHPDDNAVLRQTLAREPDTKVLALDGWTALKSLLPPKERRGITLVDPPYEADGELERLVDAAVAAHRRFATGTLMLWYPIKGLQPIARLHRSIAGRDLGPVLTVELYLRTPEDDAQLNGCGLIVLNPPYTLDAKLAVIMPLLAERLARGAGAHFHIG